MLPYPLESFGDLTPASRWTKTMTDPDNWWHVSSLAIPFPSPAPFAYPDSRHWCSDSALPAGTIPRLPKHNRQARGVSLAAYHPARSIPPTALKERVHWVGYSLISKKGDRKLLVAAEGFSLAHHRRCRRPVLSEFPPGWRGIWRQPPYEPALSSW